MKSIRERLQSHFETIDGAIPFKSFSNESLQEWMAPLLESVEDDGSISYLIKGKSRYRASPLASTIIWLSRESLLPDDILDKLQNELIFLRDNSKEHDTSPGCDSKQSDDNDGWSLGEGVSVWSTAMAIIALSDCKGIGLKKADKYKQSIIWLAKQRNTEQKGWAYQNTENCAVNAIMTALALRALSLCCTEQSHQFFKFDSQERTLLKTAISKGVDYLISTCKIKGKYAYWSFNNMPSCVATTWSLVAIKEASLIIPESTSDFFNKQVRKGVAFVTSKMPTRAKLWEEEKIVEETGAKYDSSKNYYSFTPTLLPDLFSLGVSPYHPRVVKQLQWIIKETLI